MSSNQKKPKPMGLLLAGGRSSRMRDALEPGNGDKGLLDVGGKPMLARVIERLAPQTSRLVINANGDPARFRHFGLPVVADTIDGFAGPLAGLHAGLHWAKSNAPEASHAVSVSTDVPFLPADLVDRLENALAASDAVIALARSAGTVHPVIGLWPVTLADELQTALHDGMRKVLDWTARHPSVTVDFPSTLVNGRPVDPFFNANTPQDLALARELTDSAGDVR